MMADAGTQHSERGAASTRTSNPGAGALHDIHAERAVLGGILLENSAPAPFPGTPGVGVVPQVMKFVVTSALGHTESPPAALRPLDVLHEDDATASRLLLLRKLSGSCAGTWWTIDGLHWDDVTELPLLGSTEIWSFANRSGVSHPMHVHLSMFQILDRQPFALVGNTVVPTGAPEPPAATRGRGCA